MGPQAIQRNRSYFSSVGRNLTSVSTYVRNVSPETLLCHCIMTYNKLYNQGRERKPSNTIPEETKSFEEEKRTW